MLHEINSLKLSQSSRRELPGTANQDGHTLKQKSSSILPINPFKLKPETSTLQFKNAYVWGYKKVKVSW